MTGTESGRESRNQNIRMQIIRTSGHQGDSKKND
jgi:hypothetical protein